MDTTRLEPSLAPLDAGPAADPASSLGTGPLVRRALEEILGVDELVRLCRAQVGLPPHSDSGAPRRQLEAGLPPLPGIPATLLALETAYGPRAGRGLALRVGRSCFHYGLREYGVGADGRETTFQLRPLRTRIRVGLGSLIHLLKALAGTHVQLEDQGEALLLQVEDCPLCSRGRSDQPDCYLGVGLLQEALSWASGGRIFPVEEIACIGRGDSVCSFLVADTPFQD